MKTEKVLRIKQLLETGEYRIDPYAVADAIIRWADLGEERPPAAPQRECSKASSVASVSTKTASAGPATTEPIRVRPLFAAGEL